VYSDIIQWQNSRSLIALPDGEFDGAFIGSNRMGHVQRAGRYVPPANVANPWSSHIQMDGELGATSTGPSGKAKKQEVNTLQYHSNCS